MNPIKRKAKWATLTVRDFSPQLNLFAQRVLDGKKGETPSTKGSEENFLLRVSRLRTPRVLWPYRNRVTPAISCQFCFYSSPQLRTAWVSSLESWDLQAHFGRQLTWFKIPSEFLRCLGGINSQKHAKMFHRFLRFDKLTANNNHQTSDDNGTTQRRTFPGQMTVESAAHKSKREKKVSAA